MNGYVTLTSWEKFDMVYLSLEETGDKERHSSKLTGPMVLLVLCVFCAGFYATLFSEVSAPIIVARELSRQ